MNQNEQQAALNAASWKLYRRPFSELDADMQTELIKDAEEWGPNGPTTCDVFEQPDVPARFTDPAYAKAERKVARAERSSRLCASKPNKLG